MKYSKNIHEHLNNISVVSKNLFLSLVFLFTVSFSFANSLVESKTDNNEITTEISLDNYNLDSQIISLSYSNELNKTKESEKFNTHIQGTCSLSIRGEDEWGCYFSHSITFTGVSAEECEALGNLYLALYIIGQYL